MKNTFLLMPQIISRFAVLVVPLPVLFAAERLYPPFSSSSGVGEPLWGGDAGGFAGHRQGGVFSDEEELVCS